MTKTIRYTKADEFKPDVRERAIKFGMTYPDDEELVMMIIGSGTKDCPVAEIARRIVEKLYSSNYHEIVENLCELKGVGKSRALAVAAALELGRRRSVHYRALIKTPSDILPFVRHYGICSKEHFIAITLTGAREIIEIHIISVGTLDRALVHPREVFFPAIEEKASAMILCHNHPSGNCEPSKEDIETTKILLKASQILGISILDHVIFDSLNYFSFLEHNLLIN